MYLDSQITPKYLRRIMKMNFESENRSCPSNNEKRRRKDFTFPISVRTLQIFFVYWQKERVYRNKNEFLIKSESTTTMTNFTL